MSETAEERIQRLRAEADDLEMKLRHTNARRTAVTEVLGRPLSALEEQLLAALVDVEPVIADAYDRVQTAEEALRQVADASGVPVLLPSGRIYRPQLWREQYESGMTQHALSAFNLPGDGA